MAEERVEIRSFRGVCDELERVIYEFEGIPLNPGGVPLRALAYAAAVWPALLVGSALPGLGLMLGVLPWWVHYVLLPGAITAALAVVKVQGRRFHFTALSLARHALRERGPMRPGQAPAGAGAWQPPELVMLPDGSEGRPRRLRYRGEGVVGIRVRARRKGGVLETRGGGLAAAPLLRKVRAGKSIEIRPQVER